MKEDYGANRVLNFDSVLYEHNELINLKKKRVLNDYYFINKIFLIRIKPIKSKSPYLRKFF